MALCSLRQVLRVFKRGYANVKCEFPPYTYPWSTQAYDSGLIAVKEHTCTPFESIVLLIQTGPRYEIECNHGVSYFIEHLFSKSNKCMNECQLESYLQNIGARMWANTCRSLQEITFTVPADYVENVMYYLPSWVFDINPTEGEITTTKNKVLAALKDHEKNPRNLTFDYLHKGAYSGRPLAKSVIGPVSVMEAFTKDFLLQYHERWYQPNRMTISASGPTPIDKFFQMICESMASVPMTACIPTEKDCRFSGSQVLCRNDDLPFTYCAFGVEAPGYRDEKKYIAMRLISHLVGQYNASRYGGLKVWPLTAQAADMGRLAAHYEPFYECYCDTGLWGIYFVSEVDKTQFMIEWIQDLLLRMGHDISREEFERAKDSLLKELSDEICSSMRRARVSALDLTYLCKRRTPQDWFKLVKILKRDTINEVAYEYFYDQEFAIAGVGKTESILDLSRLRGSMYWLRR